MASPHYCPRLRQSRSSPGTQYSKDSRSYLAWWIFITASYQQKQIPRSLCTKLLQETQTATVEERLNDILITCSIYGTHMGLRSKEKMRWKSRWWKSKLWETNDSKTNHGDHWQTDQVKRWGRKKAGREGGREEKKEIKSEWMKNEQKEGRKKTNKFFNYTLSFLDVEKGYWIPGNRFYNRIAVFLFRKPFASLCCIYLGAPPIPCTCTL